MSIDRGYGIATSAVIADSYDLDALIADTEAAKVAALAAQAAAETAETNAETAETNAETAETNAASSATSAASSASTATTQASAASTSATAAASSASAAATSETNAAASETAAAASETAAATSETNAATSETNAATSATSASTSATSASSSASAASTSATAAASSASAASTSETNAAASATSASTSASTATTQASNASTSASAAATSASNASTSETNAATSASNASTSETNAATSATNAATSETNAATSATNAAASATAAAASAAEAADKIGNVVEDTTPQLGGDLDTNGNDINFGDDDKAQFGAGNDLQIYHNSSNNRSFIVENGASDLYIQANDLRFVNSDSSAFYAYFVNGGSASLYHNNSAKLATTSTGIDVTGTVTTDTARSADVVDNDGSFDLDAGTNFTCTPTGNITLTFTNIPDGQSGTIVLANTGGYTISAASTTKVMGADMLTTITTAGTYVLGYISDSSVVRVYNSGAQQ